MAADHHRVGRSILFQFGGPIEKYLRSSISQPGSVASKSIHGRRNGLCNVDFSPFCFLAWAHRGHPGKLFAVECKKMMLGQSIRLPTRPELSFFIVLVTECLEPVDVG